MAKPNIVLINCDDLGYGDLGVYGSTINQTPTLDKMAAEGVRFTDFYVASGVCSPSRGAMLTGCYPQRIGFGAFDGFRVLFPGDAIGLNPDETTIAGALKDVGYSTKIIGKWHCGDQEEFLPTNHGFDSYFGLPYSNDMGRQVDDPSIDDHSRLEHLRSRPPLPLIRDDEVIQEQPDLRALTERYAEEAVRFIRGNKDNPFFLYFAHMYVHLPLYAPENLVNASENGDYGACVAGVDWVAKVLFDELKRQGLDENTLVIFTSDNGSRLDDQGGCNGELRGHKGQTWEGGQRVPCIMRWPGKIPAGEVRNELITAIDLFSTIAGATGAQLPEDRTTDSVDMAPLMFATEPTDSPRSEFFYYHENNLEAVRNDRWKLHVRKVDDEINELYDLKNDPGETKNVFDQHPDVVADLSALIQSCQKDLGDEINGISGNDVRLSGRVENPETLTHYDPEHPYIYAEYDKAERG
ncbi:sulfatase [Dehalococcoides mccartyi]|nr:sulfatase [Dehalococcoides mccartyi]